jgi:hypothetical protein
MSLKEYHRICYMYMCQWRNVPVSTHASVKLGSILHLCGSDHEHWVEIASSTTVCDTLDFGWAAIAGDGRTL